MADVITHLQERVMFDMQRPMPNPLEQRVRAFAEARRQQFEEPYAARDAIIDLAASLVQEALELPTPAPPQPRLTPRKRAPQPRVAQGKRR